MVGVAGKFKGCNTCRTRRVKCDNQRPKCQKCLESGRECEGYERQRVFIVGTTQDRGRCSSHPHRSLMTSKSKYSKSKSPPKPAPEPPVPHIPSVVRLEHEFGDPAVILSGVPSNKIQCVALHTKFLTLEPLYESDGSSFTMPSLLHCQPDLANASEALGFSLRALCLIHLGTTEKDDQFKKESARTNAKAMSKVRPATMNSNESTKVETAAEAMFLFLYEVVPQPHPSGPETLSEGSQQQTACTVNKSEAFKTFFSGSSILVKQQGPASFKHFPEHHFFTRIYRNTACFDAMSRRKASFLAEPAWCTTPWENIPKLDMDRLFDIQVLLPGIFERAERLESSHPSVVRRLKARDLLQVCHRIDKMFDEWYHELCGRRQEPIAWHAKSNPESSYANGSEWKARYDMDPLFEFQFEFKDVRTGLLHQYYWSALCMFYYTIQQVYQVYAEPVKYPQSQPRHPQPPASVPSFSSVSFDSFAPAPDPLFTAGINRVFGPAPNQFVSNGLFQPISQTISESNSHSIYQPEVSSAFQSIPSQPNGFISQPFTMGMPGVFTPMSQPSFQFDDTSLYSNIVYSSQSQPHTSILSCPDPDLQASYFLPPTPPSISSSSRSPTPTQVGRIDTSSSNLPLVPPLEPKFSTMNIIDLANKICQALPFTLRHTLDEFGPDHSAWPLWSALQVYRRQGSEYGVQAQWCENMTEMLKHEGWAFANQMGKLNWKEYKGVDV